MGCRCRDISNCSNDISKIGEIKMLFAGAEALNFFLSVELQNLAINCMANFYSVNMFDLMDKEKKLNEDMVTFLPDLVNKCENKIETLREEYNALSREDSDFHNIYSLNSYY